MPTLRWIMTRLTRRHGIFRGGFVFPPDFTALQSNRQLGGEAALDLIDWSSESVRRESVGVILRKLSEDVVPLTAKPFNPGAQSFPIHSGSSFWSRIGFKELL